MLSICHLAIGGRYINPKLKISNKTDVEVKIKNK